MIGCIFCDDAVTLIIALVKEGFVCVL